MRLSPEGYLPLPLNKHKNVHLSAFFRAVLALFFYALPVSAQTGNLIWGTWQGGGLNAGAILNYSPANNLVQNNFDFYRTHIGYQPTGGSLTVGPDSMIYGTTIAGTFREKGNLFKYNPYTKNYTQLYEFKNGDPVKLPCNDLYVDANMNIFGVSSEGGGSGSIYKYDLNSGVLTVLHQFSGPDGLRPLSGLTKASNGILYGVTNEGGNAGFGVIYSFNPLTNAYAVLHHFNNDGAKGKLLEYAPGILYGVGTIGGQFSEGQLFRFDLNTNTFTSLYSFNTANGAKPYGPLIAGTSGLLYGTTSEGGLFNSGTIFSFDTAGNQYTVLHHFNGIYGVRSPLCEAVPGIFYGSAANVQGITDGVVFRYTVSGGVITSIDTINSELNGTSAENGFVKHPDNRLYGYRNSTLVGTPAFDGAVIAVDPVTDDVSTTFVFDQYPVGHLPIGSYLAASDGMLYGVHTTSEYYYDKYLVKYSPAGDTMTVLHTFQDRNRFNENTVLHGNLIEKNGVIWGCIERSDSFPDGAVFTYSILTGNYNEVISFDTVPLFKFPRYFQMGADGNFYGLCFHKTNFDIEYIYRFNPLTFQIDTLLQYGINSNIGRGSTGDITFNSSGTKFSGMSSRTGITSIGKLFIYDISGDSLTVLLPLTDTLLTAYYEHTHHLISDSILIGISFDPTNLLGYGNIWKLNLTDTTFTTLYAFPSTLTRHYYSQYITDNFNLLSDGNLYGIVNISQEDVLMRINPFSGNVTSLKTITAQKGLYPGGKLTELPVITGVNNLNGPFNSLKLYPNPCADFIVLKGTEKNALISIVDINGKIIHDLYAEYSITSINTASLHQGLYLLRYFAGGKYQSLKFIKN